MAQYVPREGDDAPVMAMAQKIILEGHPVEQAKAAIAQHNAAVGSTLARGATRAFPHQVRGGLRDRVGLGIGIGLG